MALVYKKMSEDLAYYAKSYATFVTRFQDDLTTWQENFLEHGTFKKIVEDLSDQKEPLKVLDVGNGTSDQDNYAFIDRLRKRYPNIQSTLVEPNSGSVERYKSMVSKGDQKDLNWGWRQQSWREYLDYRKTNKEATKFQVITAIHVLYYFDMERTIFDMMACLEEGGLLVIMLIKGDSGYSKMSKLVVDNPHVDSNTGRVTEILKKHDLLQYREVSVRLFIDISDCFEEENETTREIIDFISAVKDFRKSAPPEVLSNFMEKLRSPEVSEKRGDGVFLNDECGVIIINK